MALRKLEMNFHPAYVVATERAAKVLGVALPMPDRLESLIDEDEGGDRVIFTIHHNYHHIKGLTGDRIQLDLEGVVHMGEVVRIEFTLFMIQGKNLRMNGMDFLLDASRSPDYTCRVAQFGTPIAEVNRRAN